MNIDIIVLKGNVVNNDSFHADYNVNSQVQTVGVDVLSETRGRENGQSKKF